MLSAWPFGICARSAFAFAWCKVPNCQSQSQPGTRRSTQIHVNKKTSFLPHPFMGLSLAYGTVPWVPAKAGGAAATTAASCSEVAAPCLTRGFEAKVRVLREDRVSQGAGSHSRPHLPGWTSVLKTFWGFGFENLGPFQFHKGPSKSAELSSILCVMTCARRTTHAASNPNPRLPLTAFGSTPSGPCAGWTDCASPAPTRC